MNGEHLRRMPAAALEPLVTPALVAAGLATEAELAARRDWYHGLLDLLKVRARTPQDVVPQAVPYFRDEIVYDPDAVAKSWKDAAGTAELFRETRARLASLTTWDAPSMEAALRSLAEERGVGAGKIFQPLRVALTGSGVSPGIFEVLVAMGRSLSLKRLDDAERYVRNQ
jgi:glutamyl-tRNA synthetase